MGHLPADGSNMFAKMIPPGPSEAEPHPFVQAPDLTAQIEQIITDGICLIDACGQLCVDSDSIKRIARKIAALLPSAEPEGERTLARKRMEHVAQAIWFAEWEEPFPREGTIEHAMAMQQAVAATEALAQAMEFTE